MAKFLAALLGCTLPSKGASPMLEGTIFSTLAGEKSSTDYKKEQQWKPLYCSLASTCLPNPLIEKPGGK
ncbi:Ras-GEF domain-containing family member 1B [Apodemus speciosus]|uniref:Ras-GEF domain-containing family member 1B n=1 Tax=Apodemus speciosus TaxID=105296 RepID=A0ABQ0ES67_APOSI